MSTTSHRGFHSRHFFSHGARERTVADRLRDVAALRVAEEIFDATPLGLVIDALRPSNTRRNRLRRRG